MNTNQELYKEMVDMHRDLIVVMQSAYIEWKRGEGAEKAMEWIGNTLCGPGLIPSANDPYGSQPQAFYDANNSHPLPKCFCGMPSNIGWMGQGFCCHEHCDQVMNNKSDAELLEDKKP